jgi:hypothetical protein
LSTLLFIPLFHSKIMPGKPDQAGYIEYAKSNRDLFNQRGIARYAYDVRKNISRHFLYRTIVALYVSRSDLYVEGLRLLNFLAHVITVFFAYLFIKKVNMKNPHNYLFLCTIAFAPSYLVYDLYLLRDMLIVCMFSASLFQLFNLYMAEQLKDKLQALLLFIPLVVIMYTLRIQLAFSLTVILMLLLLRLVIKKIKIWHAYVAYFSTFYLAGKLIHAEKRTFLIFKNTILLVEQPLKFVRMIANVFLGMTGLRFLDRMFIKTDGFDIHVIHRLLAIDSIVIPLLFSYMFFTNKMRRISYFIHAVFISLVTYIMFYQYAEYDNPAQSFQYRALLPFVFYFTFAIASNLYFIKERNPY